MMKDTIRCSVAILLYMALTGLGQACGDDDEASPDAAPGGGGDGDTDAASDNGKNGAGTDAQMPSEPTTGSIPPEADPFEDGPFSTVTIRDAGPAGEHTLARPEVLGHEGKRHPVVVFGNGGGTRPPFYDLTFTRLASHGFVVIASNLAAVNAGVLTEGLDWLLAENQREDSELHRTLDTDNIGAMGYSLGSLSIYQMLADGEDRVKTTVHAAGGIIDDAMRDQVLSEPGPTAYLCDGMDTKANCDGDYEVVEVPVFYGTLLGAEHITVFLPPYRDRMNGAATAWLRWYLMGDDAQESVFLGDDCRLCEDPDWTVQRKNWD